MATDDLLVLAYSPEERDELQRRLCDDLNDHRTGKLELARRSSGDCRETPCEFLGPLLRWLGPGRRCKLHGRPWRGRPGYAIAPEHRADRFWRAWCAGSPRCSLAALVARPLQTANI